MRKSCVVFFALIAFWGLAPAFAAVEKSAITLPEAGAENSTGSVIGSIVTAGNRGISNVKIISTVRSRVGDLFDPVTAAKDAKRVAELSGVEYSYYNTTIIDGQLQLTFVVVERNIIRSIVLLGNNKIKDKRLKKELSFKIGDYLDPILAESARVTLIEFYHEKGYTFVQVSLDTKQLSLGKLVFSINEGPRVKIASVKFSGNKGLKISALKKVVKAKTRKWFFLSKYYVEDEIVVDLTKLQNVYQKNGFLDSEIKLKREFNEGKDKVYLTFEIAEGPVYIIEKIEIAGNRYFTNNRIFSEFKLRQGQVYSEQKANSDTKRILKLYRETGFVDATVDQKREFLSEAKLNVKFNITENGRFRIGVINITGNKETQDKVIRHILDEYDFVPGNWYNSDIARGDGGGSGYLEKLIRRKTYSETARIMRSGNVAGQKDAQVNIIESRTGMIMLGAGVASDSGLIGQFVYEQRNFDIKDWPDSFGEFISGKAFKGAGQNLRISIEPGVELSQYSINFTEPYFNDKPTSFNVGGSSYTRARESYNENRTKGYIGFEKRDKEHWRKSINFRFENINVDSIDTDAPAEIKAIRGSNALSGVKISIGRDLTDDMFNPSDGYSFVVAYEQVGGDFGFGIANGTYRWYRTLYEDLAERKTILTTKLLGAAVLGDAPAFEKFYAGGTGAYGLRGFDYRGVSTRGLPTLPSVSTTRKDPIGSDWLFLANAEILLPLTGNNFSALFFVDSGAIDTGNYRVTIGTGIQILLPQWFGPVPMRFEIATPLLKDDSDELRVFSFSVGRLF